MKYFVINWVKNKVRVCDGKEELISYFAKFNYLSSRSKRNYLFDNIEMNKNDKKLKYDLYYSKNILIPREYIVYDESGRIIDPRFYKEEILFFNINDSRQSMNRKSYFEFKTGFTDMETKVKSIAHCGNKFRHYFRCPKTTSEKRNNAIPEYLMFVRGKRKVSHISPSWDDYTVHTEKNWKRLKLEKQYLKNAK